LEEYAAVVEEWVGERSTRREMRYCASSECVMMRCDAMRKCMRGAEYI
jgi:hypothetical protein